MSVFDKFWRKEIAPLNDAYAKYAQKLYEQSVMELAKYSKKERSMSNDREMFEKWYKDKYGISYKKHFAALAQEQLEAWQAAIAHERKLTDELVEALLHIINNTYTTGYAMSKALPALAKHQAARGGRNE